jgi:methyl-accepting chemotaxis protein
MAQQGERVKTRSSITKRFNKALLALYIVSIGVSIPITYYLTRQQVMNQANKELTILVDMVRAVRNVVREDTRPYFTAKGEFFPVTVSSTVMAKTVASKFTREQPDYYIKIASDNPLNLEDMPELLEADLLERFRQDTTLKHVVESGIVKGKPYLVSAASATAKEGCLRCHGDPAAAPEAIREKYGTTHGYHWKVGDVVGTSVVGVPLADLNGIVIKRSLIVIIALSVIYAITLFIVNSLVRRSIISPLLEITNAAYDVSHGKDAASLELSSNRDDEIGTLAHSFGLMRRSMELALQKVTKG